MVHNSSGPVAFELVLRKSKILMIKIHETETERQTEKLGLYFPSKSIVPKMQRSPTRSYLLEFSPPPSNPNLEKN